MTRESVTAMYLEGLAVDTECCQDGAELVALPAGRMPIELPGDPKDASERAAREMPARSVFRWRTYRREPTRITLTNLENPVVIAFVNATDDEERALFIARYGLMSFADRRLLVEWPEDNEVEWPEDNELRRERSFRLLREEIHHDDIVRNQARFRELLQRAAGQDQAAAMDAINSAIAAVRAFNLQPTFHLAGPRGAPRLLLKTDTLFGFMLMEIAMIVSNGVRVAECENCKTIFLTGPLTWRRAHARFCSDRCRVAAMRVRKAAAMDFNEGGAHVSS
jgi:hypothetical protein